jgi:hypothetical protein
MANLRVLFVAGVVVIASTAGCGKSGIVETHRKKGSETPPSQTGGQPSGSGGEAGSADDTDDSAPPGPCPSGWNCMDIAALGVMATDGDGKPVTASCGMGAPITCDESDPAASCQGLSEPFCAHLKVGSQELVSCAQRCTP